METLRLTAVAGLLLLAGATYLTLLGVAALAWLLPRRWLPFAPLVAPLLGWALLTAIGAPLNCALPFEQVAWALGAAALGLLLFQVARRPAAIGRFWRRRRLWGEAAWPLACAVATYALAMAAPIRAGALSAVVVDSDVEHFADVIAAMIHFPIGWSVAAQQGLEATPVGLAYHYVHASLSVLTGLDTFTTAQPSHALMLALAALSVHLFARTALGLGRGAAGLAVGLFALGGLLPVVAAFGWGQQTAAAATVPFGLAALERGLRGGDRHSLVLAGLAGAMAAGSLYLATAPLVGGAALAMAAAELSLKSSQPLGPVVPPLGPVAGREPWLGALVRSPKPVALRIWPRRASRIGGRLAVIGAMVLVAGFFSHASAAAYLFDRLHAGLLRADDVAGRSTHVATFVSLPAALGVAPLDLVRTVVDQRERVALAWDQPLHVWTARLAALAGVALVGAGVKRLVETRRWPALAVLGAAGAFELYLRVLRPFPYGEFKLLTSVWFLVVCLVAMGAAKSPKSLVLPPKSNLTRRPLSWRGKAPGRMAGALGVGVFAGGLLLGRVHAQRFLALPFGAALPEGEMAAARAVAHAVPRGASVYVSGQLTPAAAYRPAPLVTASRAGFTSQAVHADYLSRRWRGVVTSLLAFGGRPVYGLVTRHSTEVRQPVAPNAADYLMLDEAEDPRLAGALPEDLVRAAGRLRLYRNPRRPALLLDTLAVQPAAQPLVASFDGQTLALEGSDVAGSGGREAAGPRRAAGASTNDGNAGGSGVGAGVDGQTWRPAAVAALPPLPAPVLPIGDSLPGRFRVPPAAAPAPQVAQEAVGPSGRFVVGLQALQPAYVELDTSEAGDRRRARTIAVEPGLTWYTSAAVRWPAQISVLSSQFSVLSSEAAGEASRSEARVRVVALVIGGDPGREESLERSTAGVAWPLLSTVAHDDGAGGIAIEAWYSYAGPREGPYRALLRDATRLWDGGEGQPIALHLGPGDRAWTAELRPGQAMAQRASDGRQPPAPARPWNPAGGDRWLWLEAGADRDAALHSVPVTQVGVGNGAARIDAPGGVWASATALPLLAEPAAPPAVVDGTLVQGGSEAVYYVDQGRLRWVPSLETLQRLGIAWRLVPLGEADLQRLPVGLPMG